MTGHVFEKDPLWAAFADDPGDVGPEVARVVGPTALSGSTEGLAGISGEYGIEGTTEGPGIKVAEVIPDWGWSEIPCALGGNEDRSWPVLPLDEGASVKTGFGKHEAQIKASAACAEGQSVPGT